MSSLRDIPQPLNENPPSFPDWYWLPTVVVVCAFCLGNVAARVAADGWTAPRVAVVLLAGGALLTAGRELVQVLRWAWKQ